MIRSSISGPIALALLTSVAAPVGAQTTAPNAGPGRLTLPQQSDPMRDPQAPPPASPVPPQTVDPQTGRPITVRPDNVDTADADARERVQSGTTVPVPAYIPLPSGSTQQTELPTQRIADRAFSASRLPGNTVRLRPRPAYDPAGLRAGGMVIHPYIDTGVAYDANVYAEENPRNDVFAHLTGGFDAASDWGRHRAVVSGFVRRRQFGQYTSENTTTYRLIGAGRYDANSHLTFNTEATHQRVQLERGAVEEVSSLGLPTLYDLTSGLLGAQVDYGSTRLSAQGGLNRTEFRDNRSLAGTVTDQRFRNFTGYTAQTRLEQEVLGGRILYGQLDFERRRFETPEAIRLSNADVYTLTGGLRGALTPLIRGHAGVGVLRVNFQDPAARAITSLTFDTQLDWLVRERTTISLSGTRVLRTVAQRDARAALFTTVNLRLDEEVRRNLILSVGLRQQFTDYVADTRRATASGVTLGADWLLDRHWTVRPNISYLRRTDRGFNLDLGPEDAQAGVSATFRL